MNQDKLDNILTQHKLWLDTNKKEGVRANLTSADLTGANLHRANLRGANLRSAYLTSADLQSANLTGANLTGADLQSAYLTGANLRGADLQCANFYRTYLRGAYLRGANLRGADLRGADLSEIKGKEILTFQAGKDFAYSCDGFIKIGCMEHPIEYWLNNFEEIGKDNDYTENEIRLYGIFIKFISAELNNAKN